MVSDPLNGESALQELYSVENLAYQRLGDPGSPAILILHGWGSNAQIMSALAVGLSNDFEVFNLDLPGHGQSPKPRISFGVPTHAELVAAFITGVIQRQVIIVGHSNGGRIGLHMAASEEFRMHISKMVLISPSGITPQRGPKYYAKTTIAKTLKAPFVVLPEPIKSHGLSWVRGTLIWQLLGSSDYQSVTGVMRQVFVETVGFFVDDDIQHITSPVLLVWGTDDSAISRYQVDKLIAGIDDISLVELEGASHYGFLDEPAKTLESIRSFLLT